MFNPSDKSFFDLFFSFGEPGKSPENMCSKILINYNIF